MPSPDTLLTYIVLPSGLKRALIAPAASGTLVTSSTLSDWMTAPAVAGRARAPRAAARATRNRVRTLLQTCARPRTCPRRGGTRLPRRVRQGAGRQPRGD